MELHTFSRDVAPAATGRLAGRMKRFFRLLRYGLPYSLQWLPGVFLLAAVGILDTFRVLLLQPIFDQVLRPDAPEGPITLGLLNSRWHFDLRLLFRISFTCTMPGTWWPSRWCCRPPRGCATTSALTW